MRVAVAFLFGLLLAFDAVLPVGANLRTGDLISVASLGLFAWSVVAGARLDRAALVLGVVLLLSTEWMAAEAWVSGQATVDPKVQIVLGRWLLGAFAAYMMLRLSSSPGSRTALFFGVIAGTLCGFETVVRDWQTFDLTTHMPTLALANEVFIDGVYRAQGMYSHPNEAAGVVLLAAPLLIGLVEERRLPRIAVLAAAALAVAVFWITKSRTQAAVVVLLLGLWMVRNTPRLLVPVAIGGIVTGLAAMLDVLPGISRDAIGQRLLDPNLGNNIADRLFTIASSFGIVLNHPFGVGSAYVDILDRETGFTATHNAFLQLALMGGVPLLLVVLAGLLRAAWALRRQTPYRVEGWMALYLLCIFNAENYFFVSMMTVMTQFLVAAAWRRAAVAMPEPVPQAEAPSPPALAFRPRPALMPPRRRIGHGPLPGRRVGTKMVRGRLPG